MEDRVLSLLEKYGITPKKEPGERAKICCPFHQEKTPSMTLFFDSEHCFCFGCQHFCWFDQLIAKVANCSLEKAQKMLGTYDPEHFFSGHLSKKLPNYEFAEPYHDLTPVFDKLPTEIPEPMRKFIEDKGLGEVAEKIGKWKWCPKGAISWWEKHEGICIPYFAPNGEISALRLRTYDKMREKFGHSLAPQGMPLQASYMIDDPTKPVYFCEGECLTPETEVLTRKGWVRFDKYNGEDEICQWEEGSKLTFVKPTALLIKDHINGRIFHFHNPDFSATVTPRHRIPFCHRLTGGRAKVSFSLHETRAEELETVTLEGGVPCAAYLDEQGISLSPEEIALAVAYVHFFKKNKDGFIGKTIEPRIADYARSLLVANHISFTEQTNDHGLTIFTFTEQLPFMKPHYDWSWISKMRLEQREQFAEALLMWRELSQESNSAFVVFCRERSDADFVQTLLHTAGKIATVVSVKPINEFASPNRGFRVRIKKGISKNMPLTFLKGKYCKIKQYTGKVYCVQVPSTYFLIRHNGHISVTGNTDSLSMKAVGKNVICLPGVGAKKQLHSGIVHCFELGVPKLVFCGDNDEAGKKFNQYAVSAAMTLGLGIYIPQLRVLRLPEEYNKLPDGGFKRKDINDFHKEGRLAKIMNPQPDKWEAILENVRKIFGDFTEIDLKEIEGIF